MYIKSKHLLYLSIFGHIKIDSNFTIAYLYNNIIYIYYIKKKHKKLYYNNRYSHSLVTSLALLRIYRLYYIFIMTILITYVQKN